VLIGLGFIIFGFFLIVEATYATEPIIPTSLLASRGLLCTCIATLGLMMARWEVLFYSPVYTIAVRGWSPMNAGLILIPTNAGFGLGGLIVGWLHIRNADSYWA
jgi:sugar phosphate permease